MKKNENMIGLFLKYSFFSVLAMLAMSCYILADTFFVAQSLGTNGLTALNLAIPIYNFIYGAGLLLGMGGGIKFAIYKSQKEEKNANVMFTNTMYITTLFSVVFFLAGVFFSENMTMLLGADGAVFDMTKIYIKILLLFAPAFLYYNVLLCFVRNDGNPQLAMLATIVSSFSNIILDYIFLIPYGMGMFGAVLATGIAPVIGIGILAPHWLKKTKGFHMVKTKLHYNMVKTNFLLGFPSLLAQVSSGVVMITFNYIILGLEGNVGVAAYGVIANISLVVVGIYTGVSQGVQPLLSNAYGEKREEDVKKLLQYAMLTVVITSLGIYGGILLFDDAIAAIFNKEKNQILQQIAVTGLRLYFTSILFVGFNTIIAIYFAAVEKAVPAHVVSLLRGFVLVIPIAFLLSAFWGMTGVWLAFTVTEAVVSILGIKLYHIYSKNIF